MGTMRLELSEAVATNTAWPNSQRLTLFWANAAFFQAA